LLDDSLDLIRESADKFLKSCDDMEVVSFDQGEMRSSKRRASVSDVRSAKTEFATTMSWIESLLLDQNKDNIKQTDEKSCHIEDKDKLIADLEARSKEMQAEKNVLEQHITKQTGQIKEMQSEKAGLKKQLVNRGCFVFAIVLSLLAYVVLSQPSIFMAISKLIHITLPLLTLIAFAIICLSTFAVKLTVLDVALNSANSSDISSEASTKAPSSNRISDFLLNLCLY